MGAPEGIIVKTENFIFVFNSPCKMNAQKTPGKSYYSRLIEKRSCSEILRIFENGKEVFVFLQGSTVSGLLKHS